MKDDICVVEVGIHPGPYWIGDGKLVVCDRHRHQFDERDDLGPPIAWEPYDPRVRDENEKTK